MSQARAQARDGKAPVVMAQQMLEARPFPLLIRLASPNALAFLVQAAVSMAEVGFVARLGTVPLAALALTFPSLMLMQMLANGAIGGAVSSAVARTLGADTPDRHAHFRLVRHAPSGFERCGRGGDLRGRGQ